MIVLCVPGKSEEKKAFKQQLDADAILSFYHWDSYKIHKMNELGAPITIKSIDHLAKLEEKQLIVIILDKRTPPKEKEYTLEELASKFHSMGFKRVIIQLSVGRAHPDGRPTLMDSVKSK